MSTYKIILTALNEAMSKTTKLKFEKFDGSNLNTDRQYSAIIKNLNCPGLNYGGVDDHYLVKIRFDQSNRWVFEVPGDPDNSSLDKELIIVEKTREEFRDSRDDFICLDEFEICYITF